MAQWVRVHVAKTEDLSLIPVIHMVDGMNQTPGCANTFEKIVSVCTHAAQRLALFALRGSIYLSGRALGHRVFFFFRKLCLIFILCILCMRHIHGIPLEARRGHGVPLKLKLQTFLTHHIGAGSRKPRSSGIIVAGDLNY